MKRPSRIFQDEKGFYITYNKKRIDLTSKDVKENKIRGALIKLYEDNKTKIKKKKIGTAIYGKRSRRGRIEEQHKTLNPDVNRRAMKPTPLVPVTDTKTNTRRPPASKLPPEKGKDYLYTTAQEKEVLTKDAQSRPAMPVSRALKNDTFVNPPAERKDTQPSAPFQSETSKLYDLLNEAFIKQVETNAQMTKTINAIAPDLRSVIASNVQEKGIGGRPLIVPYGFNEGTWSAIPMNKRQQARTQADRQERIDEYRKEHPEDKIKDASIIKKLNKQARYEGTAEEKDMQTPQRAQHKDDTDTPPDKRQRVHDDRVQQRKQERIHQAKDEDFKQTPTKKEKAKQKAQEKAQDREEKSNQKADYKAVKDAKKAEDKKQRDDTKAQEKIDKAQAKTNKAQGNHKPVPVHTWTAEQLDEIVAYGETKDHGWNREKAKVQLEELGFERLKNDMEGWGLPENTRLTGEGIYDEMGEDEITTAMKLHNGVFCPVIAHDEIWKIKLNKTKPTFWIMNTDNRGADGTHWQAVWIDTHDICFYDSFGRDPDPETVVNIKKLVGKDHHYLRKFKINKVQTQENDTATCGWQSIEFLNKMISGESFKEATKYETPKQGEHDVDVLQKKWGYV